GDAAGGARGAARGGRAAPARRTGRHVQGLSPGALARAARPLRPGSQLRGLLDRGVAARRPLHRRAGRARAPWPRRDAHRSGPARLRRAGGPPGARRRAVAGAARRPGREQAVAPGASRPRLEDRLARLDRGASRHGGPLGRGGRRRGARRVAVRAPVWTNPAIRRDVLAVPTGQGHTAYGRYARERSFNAFDLLPAAANGYGGRTFAVRVTVRTTGEHRVLATLAGDPRELGEGIVRELPLSRARALAPGAHPFREALAPPETEPALRGWAEAQRRAASLGDYAAAQPRWGMAIDLA